MMRLLVPLLFVMVAIYWVCELLWFVFVTNFEGVVATVVIVFIVASISFCVYKWFNRGR